MTAAEENLFRRLLSLCDAQDRLTPVIHAADVRAFEALTDQLHYLCLVNVKGTYALTPAGAAARRTLIMQDEQRAREDALRAQVEAFRQQLLQVQQQAVEALERTRNEFSDYKAQQAEQHARDEDQRILDRKQSTRNQLICSALSVCLTLFLEHLPDVIGFVDVLLKSAFTFFHG